MTAIDRGTSEFTPNDVQADIQCRFGQWLLAISDPAVMDSAHYRQCQTLHRQFHTEAARVLEQALAGNRAGASQAIGPQSEFSQLSRALTMSMREWRNARK